MAANAARENVLWTQRAFWIGLITIIGLGITIFLTARSTKAAQRSARAAEKAVEGSDRPHLLISTVEIEDLASIPDEEENVALKYLYENVGKGPAWMTGHMIYMTWTDPTNVPETFDNPPLHETYWALAPGRGWGKQEFDRPKGMKIPKDLRDETIAGNVLMLAIGEVRYVDADRREHRHTFVFQYSVARKRFEPLNHPFWNYT